MDKTIKKTTEIISIVNQATREYFNDLIDVQTNPKKISKKDIDLAFDDMNTQTEKQNLSVNQHNFIMQVNHFNRDAILLWLNTKNIMKLGNYFSKKDVKYVFDKIENCVSKTTMKMNRKSSKQI